MDISSKYKPINILELEQNYDDIIKHLNSNKTFIVNGPKYSGKSTIVKLYLEIYNYDYLIIDDFNVTKESVIEKIKFRTNSVFSYFYNKKFIIVIDNFDLFDSSVKDYIINNCFKSQYILITNKYLHFKINYVRINKYSIDYLLNLYVTIFFLEKGYNCDYLPEFNNISQMYSILEFNLNSFTKNKEKDNYKDNYKEQNNSKKNVINKFSKEPSINDNYEILFDKFDYKYTDLIKEKDFNKKLYILDKINSYTVFHNNLIYNYNSIEELSDSYETLSCSKEFLNNNNNNGVEYYSILSIIGTSYKLDDFKIVKEFMDKPKKKNLKYNI